MTIQKENQSQYNFAMKKTYFLGQQYKLGPSEKRKQAVKPDKFAEANKMIS